MHRGTSELFLAHILSGDGLHHLGSGEEHVADVFEHDDEVGECGAVDATSGAGAADAADLGNDARSLDVALEDVGEACQGVHTFLYASAAGVVKTDDGGAHLEGEVLHLADFLGHGFGEATAVDGEVLCIDIGEAAVDGGATADDAVAEELLLLHAEVVAAVELEHVHFLERAFVDEECDAFACRGLTFGMLFVDGRFAASEACNGAFFY